MTLSLNTAIICGLCFWVQQIIDVLYSHHFVNRPIVLCPIVGFFLGDVQTGLMLGASLELVFMGITMIGGSAPADVVVASIIMTGFVVRAGVSLEEANALAFAIGILTQQMIVMRRVFLGGAMVPMFTRLAEKGDDKGYSRLAWIGSFLLPIPQVIVVFLAVFLGSDVVKVALDAIPAWISGGLSVASGMMPGLGLALLVSMLWSAKSAIFYFLGFAIFKFFGTGAFTTSVTLPSELGKISFGSGLGATMLFMALIAAFIAYMRIQTDLDIQGVRKLISSKGRSGEDDFFD